MLLSAAQRALAGTMRQYWGSFVRSRAPSAGDRGGTAWPPLSPGNDGPVMLLEPEAPLRTVDSWAGEAACSALWDLALPYPGPE